MIRPEQIPDEVVEAAASDIVQTLQSIASENGLTMAGIEEAMDGFREVARASIVAALNAWPNVMTTSWFENSVRKAVLNIPLPPEASDDLV